MISPDTDTDSEGEGVGSVDDERAELSTPPEGPVLHFDEGRPKSNASARELEGFNRELFGEPFDDEELDFESGHCPYCSYKSKARDKADGLRKHLTNKHPDRRPSERPPMMGFEPPVQVAPEAAPEVKLEARFEQKEQIIHSIHELHANFNLGAVAFDLSELTLQELQQMRGQIMLRVQTMAANDAAFKMLQLTCAITETGLKRFANIDVTGAAQNLNRPELKSEVHEILGQMIATGDLSVASLTPDVRLALLLSGVYYGRFVHNQQTAVADGGA